MKSSQSTFFPPLASRRRKMSMTMWKSRMNHATQMKKTSKLQKASRNV